MQHVRVAIYKITKGSGQEIADIAERGMLPIFRTHEGFIGYSLLDINETELVSISVWRSHQDAEEATALASDFVRDNLTDRIQLERTSVGDVLFDDGAFAS
jgi:heme-degrading monooxygenase HmoA